MLRKFLSTLLICVLALTSASYASAQGKVCYQIDFRLGGMGYFTHSPSYPGQTRTTAGIVPDAAAEGRIVLVWSGPQISIDEMRIRFASAVPSDGNTNQAVWSAGAGQPLNLSGLDSAIINYSPDLIISSGATLTITRASGNPDSPTLPALTYIGLGGKGGNELNNCDAPDVAVGEIVAPVLPSPTYIPTATPLPTIGGEVPRNEIYNYLATAAAQSNSLPDDPSAPGGAPLLPRDDGRQLFGYARWLLSGNVQNELLGPTIAPLGTSVTVWITMLLILVAIWFSINLLMTILKFISWAIMYVRKLLPFV
ncbi:MAG: hypothetical protein SF123_07575 [Chloroflexota bacterium]|nr:hypothetical protein [Chloroflexota bacterium]